MKTALVVLTMMLLGGCKQAADTEHKTTTTTAAEKTTAEKAFDAGLRAKKKAEAIKAEEDKKVKETDTASGNE